jgi:adenosylcobinamide-GDP ribazoletransferase
MSRFLRHYLLALQFFTRIPITGWLGAWVGFSPQMLRASAAHFPGVGWLVGVLVAGLSALLLRGLPVGGYAPLVVAALGTAFGILLTGAFHEDGLADVADGLGGSQRRERALEIMKDSRVGAFGAIAIAMALLAKVSLVAQLASMGGAVLCASLFLGHVVSRTWPLLLIRLLPHVGDAAASKSKPLADQITVAALLAALLWCVAALALVWAVVVEGGARAVGLAEVPLALQVHCVPALFAALFASALAFAWMARWFARRLQGFTGDCLGATQQVCELAFYLGFLLGWGTAT